MSKIRGLVLIASILVMTFMVTGAWGGTISLPKTGQTTCYNSTGTVISCAGTGQDGALQKGVAWPNPRFTDNGDGTITDNLTGLMWLQDASCFYIQAWGAAFGTIADFNADPVPYLCTDYTAAYADWRLPNVNELESLIHADEPDQAFWLGLQGFYNVVYDDYWTSTTNASDTTAAWFVNIFEEGYLNDTQAKSGTLYIWPVRGTTSGPALLWKTGQTASYASNDDGALELGAAWPSPRFTDNGDKTVTDNLTNIVWAKEGPGLNTCGYLSNSHVFYGTWQDALDYVKCLNDNFYRGHTNWRLPNREELRSIADYSKYNPALPAGYLTFFPYVKTNHDYWSSTTVTFDPSQAWAVYMYDGALDFQDLKSAYHYAWPVCDNPPSFPSITITAPNGGENWMSGTTQTITWTYSGNPGASVKIELYKGQALNSTLISSTPIGSSGSGSFNWAIPSSQSEGSDYTVKVTSTTNSLYTDTSSANFTISAPSGVTVTAPNGGESWTAGTTQTIRWTYSGNPGTSIKIELYKTGVLNSVIISNTPIGSAGSGSYVWAIPSGQTPGSDYTVKVTSTTNSAYNDTSNANFTIVGPPPPTITVTSPNGGESWTAGTAYPITWTYTGSPGTYVKIELYKGGVFNKTIASSVLTSSGSKSWTVPSTQTSGSDYTVKVTSTTNSAYNDTSNANFTIVGPPPPTITVTSPNGGESWTAGTAYPITWTYTGSPGTYVKIELYKGGVFNKTIASSVLTSSGSKSWTVPSTQTSGSDYTIKITSTTNSAYTDTSNGNFTIIGPPPPSIAVTSPNGGESWTAGTAYPITWTYTGSPGTYVKIELYKGGALNKTIASSVLTSSGSKSWTVPSTQASGSDYTVKVTSTTNSAYNDTSNGSCTIVAPPKALTLGCSPDTFPSGTQNIAYSQNATMTASGGTPPYTFSCTGSGPAGITTTYSGTTCTISGTPTATGTYTVNMSVKDSTNATALHSMPFTINCGDGSDPSSPICLNYNDPNTNWTTFPILPGGKIYFKAVQASQCSSGYKQMTFGITYQQTAPNLDFIVMKTNGGPVPGPFYGVYVTKLAQTGYDAMNHNDGTYFWKFVGTQSGSGETTYVPSTFTHADTYYILVVNTSTSESTTFDMKYYCR